MKAQRILIADDDEKVLDLLQSSLQKSGYEVALATNGVDALELAKKENPDLILADVAMPEMDGFELCRHVRENSAIEHIPYIFLTAKSELHDKVKGLNLGADDYISKPFHITEVTARINAILQRVTQLSQQASEAEDSELQGNLKQMQMAELLQTLAMSQKSGGLKLVNSSQKIGKIFFEHGNIVQASLDRHNGEEAVYRILMWDEGFFRFDSSDSSHDPPIEKNMNSLLMEGFDQREECQKYRKNMPSFSHYVHVRDKEGGKDLKPASKKVFDLIDGQKTIQQIIDDSPLNYLLTIKILYTLLKKKILEAKAPDLLQRSDDADFGELAHELYK
ncbi:hypothetical protein CSB45_07650 [candidate division KSB3 bacterium]|uniref:Response regulatory domain-containing protein n=1 Tax=candidate division KSB3 bacterium TaxID=2044937 RepID=A0A2G6E5M6_9BACT|nr:MAG: hypothetical protein CSB45_07650 [candidate division KSB3 bacterium]PIE29908.1 MAG: hypothetical protein CSA57_06355 [candidate division KSB3 bacterium]